MRPNQDFQQRDYFLILAHSNQTKWTFVRWCLSPESSTWSCVHLTEVAIRVPPDKFTNERTLHHGLVSRHGSTWKLLLENWPHQRLRTARLCTNSFGGGRCSWPIKRTSHKIQVKLSGMNSETKGLFVFVQLHKKATFLSLFVQLQRFWVRRRTGNNGNSQQT